MTKKKSKITAVMLAKDVLKWLNPKTRGKIRLRPARGTGFINPAKADKRKRSRINP